MTLVADRKEDIPMPQSVPSPTAPARSPCVGPAVLSGVLLWMCYFPLALGWLSWVALVPFLTLTRAQARPRRIYWSAYLAGLVFFVPVLQWMRVADTRMYATWAMLATYCAVYFPVALWMIRWLDRRTPLPLCLNVPLVWVALEWVRSFALTGFAWYYLGHAQHRFASLIQVSDLGGAYAVSFLVAAVNGWLVDLAFRLPALRDRFVWTEKAAAHVSEVRTGAGLGRLWAQGTLVATLLVAAILYGAWRLDQRDFMPGPRLALLQGNLDQRIRNLASMEKPGRSVVDRIYEHYAMLCYLAAGQGVQPDLVVWPETSYPASLYPISPNLPIEKVPQEWIKDAQVREEWLREYFTRVLPPAEHLIGLNVHYLDDAGKPLRYSSALQVKRGGKIAERFDKMHRVPFGEFVPLRDWLPFMNYLAPYESDYSISPGLHFTRFPLADLHYGCLICYEDTDPFLARRYLTEGADGKPVDFLVNQSNDGWFDGSSEHDEHLVISRFRAIECRRSLVRSVNMGISAVIDGNGRVLRPQLVPQPPPEAKFSKEFREELSRLKVWEVPTGLHGPVEELPPTGYGDFKKQAGVLLAQVPLDQRMSLYTRWGDWLPIGCWGLFAMFFLVKRFKSPASRGA